MSVMFNDLKNYKDVDSSSLGPNLTDIAETEKVQADPEFVKELHQKHKLFTGATSWGTYRIEVIYEYRRSSHHRTYAMINVYKSNKDRALDLDEPLFFCSSEEDETAGCGKVLTGDELLATLDDGSYMKVLFCEQCKKHVNRQMLCSSLFMNNEPNTIAKRVYALFRELKSDADIVITYNKKNIKSAQEEKRGEGLTLLREQRERAIYPLYRIVQDSEGDILKKIENFLKI